MGAHLYQCCVCPTHFGGSRRRRNWFCEREGGQHIRWFSTGWVEVSCPSRSNVTKPKSSQIDFYSLPHWIAYWAVGWQTSISLYKDKIYTLVQTMFQTLEYVLPSNRRAVDEYLFHPSFWRIELLLRSTRSVNPKVLQDPDLTRITELYSIAEEERIEANLRDVAYELDTPATVSLITGEGRIERVRS